MEAAGVPVLGNLTADSATEADLPLLVKASAGGGGRGMRVVRALADLPAEIAKAAAEAASAFGDGTVFVEPYVEHGRHVEVQVVGHSARRAGARRAGLLDPAPAPEGRRGVARRRACPTPPAARCTRRRPRPPRPVDYRGAGTVEFLYDPATERFFFLEMNTRLQVEHPVTELRARRRPRRAPADRWPRAATSTRTRSAPTTATPSRSGCTPRTRPPTGSPRAGG